MPPNTTENTETVFKRDWETVPEEKTALLSGYLADAWSDLDIVRIDRIENGHSGWQATYRV